MSKRNFKNKLAHNIKSDRVYSELDKVGPLLHNAGYIITQVFLIDEELNMHFSSVFTIEDTSALPVTETKFNGTQGKGWGS